MPRTPKDVTDLEWQVLEVLWDLGGATIRQVADSLYPNGTTAQYATIQKLLERLEDKLLVQRERASPAHLFRALQGREELIGRRLQDMAEKLCGGSLTPLLTHLLRTSRLGASERKELRDLIDELDETP